MAETKPKLKNPDLLSDAEFYSEYNGQKKRWGFNITFFELGARQIFKGVKMVSKIFLEKIVTPSADL